MTGILVALLVVLTAALSFLLGMIFGVAAITKQKKEDN